MENQYLKKIEYCEKAKLDFQNFSLQSKTTKKC